jgi:hypothetical protein
MAQLFALLLIIISIWISWRLVSKTGYSGVLALLLYIPFVNLLVLLFLAFSEWPVEEKLREYRKHFGELPQMDLHEGPKDSPAGIEEESECLECHTLIPKGRRSCPHCGWSY